MTKQTIRAIKSSIKHWERDILKPLRAGDKIRGCPDCGCIYWQKNGKSVPYDQNACPLCKLYFDAYCVGCPLNENGMRCGALDSPYEKFTNTPTLRNTKAMIKALQSLLPKGERK